MTTYGQTTKNECRSRCFFLKVLVCLVLSLSISQVTAADRPAQTLQQIGTTPLFAQVLSWSDSSHFAVGRWDGTISLFRMQKAGEYGPVVTESMVLPSGAAVEMLAAFNAYTLITSDGRNALAVWRRPEGTTGDPGKGFMLAENLAYDATYGAANSGLAFDSGGDRYLATGHENGWVIFWQKDTAGHFSISKAIDVRSPNAPSNP